MTTRRNWERGIYPEGRGNLEPEPMDTRQPRIAEPDFQVIDPSETAPRRLLDNTDLNIGRQALILANVPAAVGDAGRGRATSLLQLTGDSKWGSVVTVTFGASDPRNFEGGSTLAVEPGCPVGIIEFGNGGGMAQMEVDIPNPHTHSYGQPYNTSGVCVSVPAGYLRVSARDDSRIIPGAGQTPLVADGTNAGQLISAHVVYGDKGSSAKIYRSLPFANTSLAAGASVIIRVPAFARNVQFIRNTKNQLYADFRMIAGGNAFLMDQVNIPTNTDSPVFPVPPRASQLLILNNGATPIDSGWAVFEIAL